MSKVFTTQCCVKCAEMLKRACDRLREQGIKVEGPEHVTDYVMFERWKKHTGQGVQLPGWRFKAVFGCDEDAKVSYDLHSPFEDETHPEVVAGRKRVGEDGKWGDLAELDRLTQTYTAAVLDEPCRESGGTLVVDGVDEETGELVLYAEYPEEESIYG